MLSPLTAAAAMNVVIIEGLGGEPAYTQQFDAQVQALRKASATMTPADHIQQFSGDAARRAAVLAYFQRLKTTLQTDDRLVLYLVGHGSFDGYDYKFNIPGPDLTGKDIAVMLDGLPAQQQLVVATGSASGALLEVLKRPTRTLISATRSGMERNATHFGEEFVAAFSDASADTDKSDSITAKEAFDYASRRVKDYFEHQTQLASEHAVLQGDRADRFTIMQLHPSAPAAASMGDQVLLRQRDELSAKIEDLRVRKDQLSQDDYSQQLELLLLQLAALQERIDKESSGAP